MNAHEIDELEARAAVAAADVARLLERVRALETAANVARAIDPAWKPLEAALITISAITGATEIALDPPAFARFARELLGYDLTPVPDHSVQHFHDASAGVYLTVRCRKAGP